MKNYIYPLILIVFLASCKKDDTPPEQNISGTWLPVTTTYIETEFQGNTQINSKEAVFIGKDGEYLAFTNNGVVGWRMLEKGTDANGEVWYGTDFELLNTKWTRNGNILTIGDDTDKDIFTISKLDDFNLTIESTAEAYSGTGIKYVTYSKHVFKK